jgi:hypothetical protein
VNFDTVFSNIRFLMTLGHADRSVISQFGFDHVNQVYWFPALLTIVRLPCRIVFCLNLYATQKNVHRLLKKESKRERAHPRTHARAHTQPLSSLLA